MIENNGCIWIINQYASHLEQRHLQLSKVFAENGYKSVIITSSFHHGNKSYVYKEKMVIKEIQNGITYVYLHSEPAYEANGARRIINMLDFSRLVHLYEKQIAADVGAPDYVIASSAPPFVWENGYKISRRYNAKFIAEFRDIWPQSFIDIQGMSAHHPWIVLLSAVEKRAYKRADAIVSTMPFANRHVCEDLGFPQEKVHWMPNGINTTEAEDAKKANIALPADLDEYLMNNWCCIYTGSFVKSEAIPVIIDSVKNLEGVKLAIVGDGADKAELESIIQDENISNVRIFPRISRAQVPIALQKAKCCIAASHNYPIYQYGYSANKIPEYMYSGTPTIFSCVQDGYYGEDAVVITPAESVEELRAGVIRVKQMTEEEILQRANINIQSVRETYEYHLIGKRYLSVLIS